MFATIWQPCRRSSVLRLVGVAGLAFSLAACGFKPLYGDNAGGHAARSGIAQVAIPAIGSERIGQQVRNELIDRLTPGGQPRAAAYSLEVSLEHSITDLLIQQNADVLRRKFVVQSDYRLIDNNSGEVIFTGRADRSASFNRLDSEYANVIAERDAEERAAISLADSIAERIGVFFAASVSPAPKPVAAAAPVPAAPRPAPVPEPAASADVGLFPPVEAVDASAL